MKMYLYSIPAFILRQWLCRVLFSGLLMLCSVFAFAQAPTASFSVAIDDTVWISSPCDIENTSVNSQKNYWDVVSFSSTYSGPYNAYPETRQHKNSNGINAFFLDTALYTNDFTGYTFPTRGYYLLKLVAWNTSGFDTYIDTLFVDTPSSPPVADFSIEKNIIGVYDVAQLTDLSTNGALTWYWYLDPPFFSPAIPFFNMFGPSSAAQHPLLYANEEGIFDVCLQATNHRGTTTICKPDLIRIIPGYQACAGSAMPSDTVARDHEGMVRLYTIAGTYIPSLVGTCPKGYTIETTGDTLTLFIERFKMRIIDSLFIRSGSKTGPILYKFGGSTALDSLKIAGGVAFLQTVLGNVISGGDEGWTIRWRDSAATALLPVSFISFEGKLVNRQDAQLMWSTASEQNNKGFAIERSANGSDWLEVDFVKGKATSSKASQYSFTDVSPFRTGQSILYYRLRQVDFDGKVHYSTSVAVQRSETQKMQINVSPNPFEGIPVLTIQSDKAALSIIGIFDIYGKQLMVKEAMLVKGTNTIALPETGTLKPGSYILNVTSDNNTQAFRLLKK